MKLNALLLALAMAAIAPAEAGYSVYPTALYLLAPNAVTTLYLRNNTDTTNVYQVGAAAWIDRQEPTAVGATKDIAVSPAVLRLAPGETGRVRIQAARPGVGGSGKAYRVLARQVTPKRPGQDLSVSFNIQFNVPLLTNRK